MVRKKKLKILIACSEMVPYAKTGGLADVTGALIDQLRGLGHEVRAVMPYYSGVAKSAQDASDTGIVLDIPVRKNEFGKIFETRSAAGSPVYLVQHDGYYGRDQLYGTPAGDFADNAERFIFFNKAVFELIRKTKFVPDVIHCHDWQTGLIPAMIRTVYASDKKLGGIKTVFTIHNLAYQGLFWYFDMTMTGLPHEAFSPEGLEFYGKMNFMKSGLVFSDKLTTVSEKYSHEIQTREYGCGLEGVLQKRRGDLCGILNGVDYDDWSPQKDKFIAARFSASSLKGKEECRADLLKEYGMKGVRAETPVIGIVSRLTDQKGFDIFAEAVPRLMAMDLCFAVLGTGEAKYHKLFEELAAKYPEKMGVKITFNNAIAHKIEAGSDMFLMPSLFEPCGLNQIYSLKYGTIPVVRATGGLDDTITRFDPSRGEGNGFKFEQYSADALVGAVSEALQVWRSKTAWKKVVRNAMGMDFSWERSTLAYEELFCSLLG